jgi:hypothetical protein
MAWLAQIPTVADGLLARWRSRLGDFMPVYFFCAVYFLTVVVGNLIYLTPYGPELARAVGAHNDGAALRYVAMPSYWLLLTLPFLIVPVAATVARRWVGHALDAKLPDVTVGEFGLPTHLISSALVHVYCIYVISSQDILALNATPADAASSVELRYVILAKVGFVFRLLTNSVLPFLVVYAAFAAARTRRLEWWTLYCGNALLNSVYLILLNMKWPVLVFWLINLIALFYVATRHLFAKLIAVSAIYVVCYLSVSVFVLGFEARIFRSTTVAEVPIHGELQLAASHHLLGPAAPGVEFEPRGGALLVTTIPTDGYQVGSALIRSAPGERYAVSYTVEVTSGEIDIGVMDADNERWVALEPIVKPTGRFTFTAKSGRFRLILVNAPKTDVTGATFRIKALSLSHLPSAPPVGDAAKRPESLSDAEMRVFHWATAVDIPPKGELQLVGNQPLLGPIARGVRLEARDGALEVATIATGGYQVGSVLIRSVPRETYAINYAIDATPGAIDIGVMDADNDRWITTQHVVAPTGKLAVVAPSKQLRIVLINTPRPDITATAARIRALSVSGTPAAGAAKAEVTSDSSETRAGAPDSGTGSRQLETPDLQPGQTTPGPTQSPGALVMTAPRAAAPVPEPSNQADAPPKSQDRPSQGSNVAVQSAGRISAVVDSGVDRGSRLAAALINRMAIAVPFYYAEFSEKGWVCGTVWDRVVRKPSPCSPAIYIYNRMFEGDAFQNRGTATAAVNISGYALGGWPVAIIATSLAGFMLGGFAAFGRDWDASPLRASIWIMGIQVAYFLTQLPFEGAIIYDHGALWWSGLVMLVGCATVAGRVLRRRMIASSRAGAAR